MLKNMLGSTVGILLMFLALVGSVDARQRPLRLSCATAQGIKTEAELSAAPGSNIVNVTFIGRRPGSREIDRILRDCLMTAAKIDASQDILGTAWFRAKASDDPNDDEIIKNYGALGYLSYQGKTKRIEVRQLGAKAK